MSKLSSLDSWIIFHMITFTLAIAIVYLVTRGKQRISDNRDQRDRRKERRQARVAVNFAKPRL